MYYLLDGALMEPQGSPWSGQACGRTGGPMRRMGGPVFWRGGVALAHQFGGQHQGRSRLPEGGNSRSDRCIDCLFRSSSQPWVGWPYIGTSCGGPPMNTRYLPLTVR